MQPWCKKCKKEYDKEWYENNKEQIKGQKKEYYESNKKQLNEQMKEYHHLPILFDSNTKRRQEIELYEKIKKSKNGNVMCRCAYCGEWFESTYQQIQNRLRAINEINKGEGKLYCSDKCKINCPIYGQYLYQKNQKSATSKEVQPEPRQMVFARDNYTCQKCNTHKDNLEVDIHCHHKESILWEPLQSADIDMCITLCEDYHKAVHQIPGCSYQDMKCV